MQTFAQDESIGDDGLMVQSTFDTNIDDDHNLMQLYLDPNLLFGLILEGTKLSMRYWKLLDSVMSLQLKKTQNVTLFAVKRCGDLIDLRINGL